MTITPLVIDSQMTRMLCSGRNLGASKSCNEERDTQGQSSAATKQEQSLFVSCLVLFSSVPCPVLVGQSVSPCQADTLRWTESLNDELSIALAQCSPFVQDLCSKLSNCHAVLNITRFHTCFTTCSNVTICQIQPEPKQSASDQDFTHQALGICTV